MNIALNRPLQRFMACRLLVGVAALGVISLRSVVERRRRNGVPLAQSSRVGPAVALRYE